MDFADRIRELAAQLPKLIPNIKTEEATKHALVLPFITALGYNIFDPSEVTPELVADVGVKQGEKVDYAILRAGEPIILFECKSVGTDLDTLTPSQLFRYFTTTKARFAIFTNGIRYLVFSDLEEQNKMDIKPFLELDMSNIEDIAVDEFKRFTKETFDVEKVLSTALEYKYTRELKRILNTELREPTEEFIKLLAGRVHSGRMTQNTRERFSLFIKRAWSQIINDLITERLRTAIAASDSASVNPIGSATSKAAESASQSVEPSANGQKTITTAEELEAYMIIKAILRESIEASRIVIRDQQTFCSVLLDDNNRKTIARLYFNNPTRKYIGIGAGVWGTDRQEVRIPLDTLDDIYKLADRLKESLAGLNPKGN